MTRSSAKSAGAAEPRAKDTAAPGTPAEGLHAAAVLQGLAARLGLPVLIFPWGAGYRIVNHAAQKEVWLSASGELIDVPFDPKGAPAADPSTTRSG